MPEDLPDNWTPVMNDVGQVHPAAFEAWRYDRQPGVYLMLFSRLRWHRQSRRFWKAAECWIWRLRIELSDRNIEWRYADRRPPAPFRRAEEYLNSVPRD